MAEKYRVREKVRFNTKVHSATWDAEKTQWLVKHGPDATSHLETRKLEVEYFNIIISATSILGSVCKLQ